MAKRKMKKEAFLAFVRASKGSQALDALLARELVAEKGSVIHVSDINGAHVVTDGKGREEFLASPMRWSATKIAAGCCCGATNERRTRCRARSTTTAHPGRIYKLCCGLSTSTPAAFSEVTR